MKGADGGVVDVAKEKVVDRPVPISSECIPRGRVPPIRVESSVRESSDFCQDVELHRTVLVEQAKMVEKPVSDRAKRF